MASDVTSFDLNAIQDESLLRKMWQETEDYGKKKEIRAHMYKLRENRLRDFYTGDMDSGIGLTKSPMTTSHGDSLAGQSFQSFKAKEIRDCASPIDYKFAGSVAPDTSGWNVVTSAEVSADGRSEKLHLLAMTGGSQEIPGGKASFAGRNENLSTMRHEGDDKNFTTSMGESTDTHLQESSVTSDPLNGRVESKTTSSNTSSSTRTFSKQFQSSDDGPAAPAAAVDHQNAEKEFNEMLRQTAKAATTTPTVDTQQQRIRSNVNVIDNNQRQDSTSSTTISSKTSRFIRNEQENQNVDDSSKRVELDRNDSSRADDRSTTTSRVIRSSDTMTKDQRSEEAFRLAALPGEILSRKVDYPNANTQMVTERKRLEDGTVVTTTRYETRSASTEISAQPSEKQEASTSRVVTEDRATRNRTEVIYDKNNTKSDRVLKDDTDDQRKTHHRRNSSRSEIVIQRDDLRASVDAGKKSTDVEDRSQSVDNVEIHETTKHRVVKKDLSANTEQMTKQQEHRRHLENITVDTDRSYAPSEVSELSPRSQQTFDYNTVTSTKTTTLHKDKRHEQDYHSNKRISVEVDSAHDSFARSLRSVSPTINNTRSTTTSQTSLRSTLSPEKHMPGRSPSRESDTSRISTGTTVIRGRSTNTNSRLENRKSTVEQSEVTIELDQGAPKAQSPFRRAPEGSPTRRRSPTKSPEKFPNKSSTNTTTRSTRTTRKQETEDTTRDYDTESARSTSPTCTVSDIEYHPGPEVINKFVNEDTTVVTQKTANSSVVDSNNSTIKKSSLKQPKETFEEPSRDETDDKVAPKESRPKAPYTRSETYEERCRQILGMNKTDSIDIDTELGEKPRRGSKPIEPSTDFITNERRHVETQQTITDRVERADKSPSRKAKSPERKSSLRSSPASSPERKKPIARKESPMHSPERKSIVEKVTITSRIESVAKDDEKKPQPTSRSTSPQKSHSPDRITRRPASPQTIRGSSPDKKQTSKTTEKVTRIDSYTTRRNSKPLSPERPVKKLDQPETITRRQSIPKTIVLKPAVPHDDTPATITRGPKSPDRAPRKHQTTETSPTRKAPLSNRSQSAVVTTTTKTNTLCSRSASLPQRPQETSPTRKPVEKRSPSTQDVTERRSSVKTTDLSKSQIRKPTEVSPERKARPSPTIKTTPSAVTTNKTTKVTSKKATHSDYSSEEETKEILDDDETELLAKTITNKRFNKILERKESAPVYRSTKTTDTTHKSMNRSASENVMKASPTRNRSKPDSPASPEKMKPFKSSEIRRPSKCITTKTINLSPKKMSPEDNDNDDVIIDMQQAKSSREHSPNRMIPVPVSPEQDTGKPRFPDDVEEPEERPKRKKAPTVKDMTIMEENTQEYMRCSIMEVDDDQDDDDDDEGIMDDTAERVKNRKNKPIAEDATDDCMLSVSDKVSKFITSAEEVTKTRTSMPFKPDTDGTTNVTDSDECLMSVNEKVSKFITTAEEVSKPKASTVKDVPVANINEKVAQFLETADKVTTRHEMTTAEKKTIQMRSPDEPLDENLREDECLLSVSDKVNKFANTVEKLQPSPSQKSPELVAKIHRQVSLKDIVKTEETTEDEEEPPTEAPRKGSITERYTPKEKPVTPTHIDIRRSDSMKRAKAVFERNVSGQVPKDILSRPSVWEAKRKSQPREENDSEFETEVITETTEAFYLTTPDDRELPKELDRAFIPAKEPKSVPAYMRDTVSSKKNIFEKKISSSKIDTSETIVTKTAPKPQPKERSPTRRPQQQSREPSMEKALDRDELMAVDEPVVEAPVTKKNVYTTPPRGADCHHPTGAAVPAKVTAKSPDTVVSAKRSLFENKEPQSPQSPRVNGSRPSYMSHTVASLEHIRRESVEHKSRRDSGEMSPIDGNPRSGPKAVEMENVEEIFELEVLEEMLEAVTNYELRRRIRNQIRVVKKHIEENLQQSMVITEEDQQQQQFRESRPRSPVRKVSATSPVRKSSRTEQNFSNTSSSTTTTSTTRQSSTVQRTTTRDESAEKRSSSPAKVTSKVTTVKTTTGVNGQRPRVPQESKEEKPIWAQKNILKKASENTRVTSSTKSVADQKAFARPKTTPVASQMKDSRVTDCCVTSSYGIGPTDDNGRPIFGLRALKKKKETPNGTVTGTIVQETYYSENGGPATGQRTVTMYSNDEDQLKEFNGKRIKDKSIDRESSSRNLITMTKSQKIVGGEVEPLITTMSTSNNTLTRRGSVKEMSEKFIQKESAETAKVNGSSSYPKAGLILRTQSNRSRSSTDGDEHVEIRSKSGRQTMARRSTTTTEQYKVDEGSDGEGEQSAGNRTSSTRTTKTTTRSFLNSAGEKVTDVNDVLDRMRNADNVEENGDTEEDREARALLNKFLGASVLMSGVESMLPGGSHKEVVVSSKPSSHQVTKTVTSRTVRQQSGSAPVTTTTTVVKTSGNIDEIVDEEILKKLLEQATNYEERRKLRARIKQVMADKEAEKKEAVAALEKPKQVSEGEEDEESYEYVTDSEAGEEEEEEKVEAGDGETEEEEEEDDEEEEVIEEQVTVTEVGKNADEKKAGKASTQTATSTTSSSTAKKGTETKSVSTKLTTKTTTTVQTKKSSQVSGKSTKTTTSTTSGSSGKSEEKKSTVAAKTATAAAPTPTAAAVAVKPDSSDSSSSKAQESGESLLLPLLQGLLHKNSSQRSLNASEQNMSEMMVPHVEDSGTESGEDLRLLAAGLQNAMHKNSQSTDPKVNREMGLLEEVTAALERLESSLKAGADMNMHKGKKQNLLLLVSRLKSGLMSPEKLDELSPEIEQDPPHFEEAKEERRMSGHGRFAKRKNRNNRHTVGVSREELADARQLMEDMMIRKSIPNMETANVTTSQGPSENYALQKQLSLGAVLYRPHQFVPEEIKKNTQALAKSTPQFPTPVTYYQEKKPKFKFIRQSMSLDQGPEAATTAAAVALMPNNRNGVAMSHDLAAKGILKVNGVVERRVNAASESSEEEFEPGQTNGFDYDGEEYKEYNHRKPFSQGNKPGFLAKGKDRRKIANRCRTPPGKLFEAPPAAAVQKPYQVTMMMASDEDAARKKSSKFSKKLRMKRANTIDIPKPLGFSTADDSDEEDELADHSEGNSMSHSMHLTASTVGLKKAIDVGDKVKTKRAVPKFKPQTENDHKFLAFIQRQAPQHGSNWINPNSSSPGFNGPVTAAGHNWNNKFGNIKNAFEKPAPNWAPTTTSVNANKSARHFWHKSEEGQNSKFPSIPPFSQQPQATAATGAHINNHHQQQQQQPLNRHPHLPRSKASSTAWKQRTMSQPEIFHYEPNEHGVVVAGSNGGGFRIRDAEFVPPNEVEYYNQPPPPPPPTTVYYQQAVAAPVPPPQIIQQAPIYQPQPVVAIPKPVNQFSHAPMSAFKPIPKKIQQIPAFKPIEKPDLVIDNVRKRKDSYNQLDAKAQQKQAFSSPTRNIANSFQRYTAGNSSPASKSPTLPWTQKPVFENRVLNLATTKFDQNGKVSPRTQTMKYKSPTNSIISSFSGVGGGGGGGYSPVKAPSSACSSTSSKMFEKRGSLPNTMYPFYYEDDLETMKNTRLNENLFVDNPSYVPMHRNKSDPPPSPRVLSRAPHSHSLHDLRQPEMQQYHAPPLNNYVVTDYTPQSCVSTCLPTWRLTEPVDVRNELESITNPNAQPLVLTCSQPVYSPSQQQQQQMNGHNGQPETLKIFDYPSPVGGSSNNETSHDEWDDEPELTDSTEYKAVSSRVMTGPVQQTAVTVSNKVKKRFDDEERDSRAAKSLQSVLRTIKKVDKVDPYKSNEIMGAKEVVSRQPAAAPPLNVVSGVPAQTRSDNMFSQYPVASVTNESPALKKTQPPPPPQPQPLPQAVTTHNVVPLPRIEGRAPQKIVLPQSVAATAPSNSRSPLAPKSPLSHASSLAQYRVPEIVPYRPPQIVETPATPQTQSHVVFNNVGRGLPPRDPQARQSFTMSEAAEREMRMRTNENGEIRGFNVGGSALSKSDSWHQICQLNQAKPASPVANRSVQRAKSNHNLLALPKQYEGGIDREKLQEKQKAVSAYFGASRASEGSLGSSSAVMRKTTTTTTSTSINRIKTCEKASVGNQKPSSGLCRSNTMPSMAPPTKLDETNIDDAFEDLFNTAMQ